MACASCGEPCQGRRCKYCERSVRREGQDAVTDPLAVDETPDHDAGGED